MKKTFIWALVVSLFSVGALADGGVYTGSVAATDAVYITAPADGVLASSALTEGTRTLAGDVLAEIEPQRVYAQGDGVVTATWAEAGEKIEGTLMEIEPFQKYTVYASTDGAYSAADNLLIHTGEELYIKCTSDGTHRGTGVVTAVDGDEFNLRTTAGEFFVGETVYLFRDADFTSASRVGKGTLIYSDNDVYEAEGVVSAIYVKAGDYVERGELLCEISGDDGMEITAPVDGVIAAVSDTGAVTESAQDTEASVETQELSGEIPADISISSADEQTTVTQTTETTQSETTVSSLPAAGDTVSKDAVLAAVYPNDAFRVEFYVSEEDIADVQAGGSVTVEFADQPDTEYAGTIESISMADDGDGYLVVVNVERDEMYLGMTCTVFTDGE